MCMQVTLDKPIRSYYNVSIHNWHKRVSGFRAYAWEARRVLELVLPDAGVAEGGGQADSRTGQEE